VFYDEINNYLSNGSDTQILFEVNYRIVFENYS